MSRTVGRTPPETTGHAAMRVQKPRRRGATRPKRWHCQRVDGTRMSAKRYVLMSSITSVKLSVIDMLASLMTSSR
ncbi:hypothetical protein NL676_021838 [Syzygium grande]|nr:hypothetical protein NL676_021838 [Syzygium grande]